MPEALEKMIGINCYNLFRECKMVHIDSICCLPFYNETQQTSEYSRKDNIYNENIIKDSGRIIFLKNYTI